MLSQARMLRSISLIFFLALPFAGLSGCSTWVSDSFQDPDVRLLKVDVVHARLLEQQFVLHFRIDNPNSVSLPVRGLVYTVHLNDVKLASGESNIWFTVPAHGRQTFQVPVRTNLWRHMKYIVRLLEKPNNPIYYQLQGEVKTGLMFGKSVHLSRNGEIIPGSYIPE